MGIFKVKNKNKNKFLILLLFLLIINKPVFAESLFRAGASQSIYASQPRSLFASVKAKAIGDLVMISINELTDTSDSFKYANTDSTAITDNFSTLWNKFLPKQLTIPQEVDGFGGGNKASNQSSSTRKTTLKEKVTTQVVQIFPNGNLLVQGKKTKINSGDKVNIIVSGIIDPRLIDSTGSIDSSLVANLQIAFVGSGNISRTDYQTPLGKVLRYLY